MNARDGVIPQVEVVAALILRETRTRFGTHQLGYLWAFIEPILWILSFHVMFSLTGRTAPYGTDIVSFIATGMIPFQMFRETTERASKAVDANKALLFYPQVRPLDLVLARSVLEGLTLTTVLVALLCINGLLTGHWGVQDPLAVLAALCLATMLGCAFGLVIGALSIYSPTVPKLVGPVLRPLFWISGIFFNANALPSQARDVLLWNPVLHAVEMVRDGYFHSYQAHYVSPGYLGIWIIVLLAMGLLLERAARRRLEVT